MVSRVRGRVRKMTVERRRVSVKGVLPGRVSGRGVCLRSEWRMVIPRAVQRVATLFPGGGRGGE